MEKLLQSTINVNKKILEMEYAVRGPIPQRAAELQRQGKEIIFCNIGNPQALGQPPMSYFRQVLSLVEDPDKIQREQQLKDLFEENPYSDLHSEDFVPEDVLETSKYIITQLKGGMGAYTESKGMYFIRQSIADFIDKRDGYPHEGGIKADPENIFLTSGASEGAKFVIDLLIAHQHDGIMIPIPQYPLYSASIKKAGGIQVDYYPDEDRGWALEREILEDALNKARLEGVSVKGIVVINPGNPTGAVLSEESVNEVIEFAGENNLVIIADEVYQENVYNRRFVSFARALGQRKVPLFSLHSISKGYFGECGHRGGYLEVRNPPLASGSDLDFIDLLLKQASVSLCANTAGQIMTYLMVTPPTAGSLSSLKYNQEKNRILDDLRAKAVMVRDAFRQMRGVECFGETGAMYLFPRLNHLPEGTTDFDYCMALLEETGLCTVNGSGFGQKPGTHHLRIAFLPPKALLEEILPRWIEFHNRYVSS